MHHLIFLHQKNFSKQNVKKKCKGGNVCLIQGNKLTNYLPGPIKQVLSLTLYQGSVSGNQDKSQRSEKHRKRNTVTLSRFPEIEIANRRLAKYVLSD